MKNSKLDAHKRQWYAYYSEKRIVHQWFQVKLLENLPVQRIMEIGPAYGVPTALLANAGYEVTTLDFMKRDLFFLWCTHFVFAPSPNET
jgi:2-polyprenyl-3-methyl-5-hydroxy-6-metoxy-1,4-benzoquinol methylase